MHIRALENEGFPFWVLLNLYTLFVTPLLQRRLSFTPTTHHRPNVIFSFKLPKISRSSNARGRSSFFTIKGALFSACGDTVSSGFIECNNSRNLDQMQKSFLIQVTFRSRWWNCANSSSRYKKASNASSTQGLDHSWRKKTSSFFYRIRFYDELDVYGTRLSSKPPKTFERAGASHSCESIPIDVHWNLIFLISCHGISTLGSVSNALSVEYYSSYSRNYVDSYLFHSF